MLFRSRYLKGRRAKISLSYELRKPSNAAQFIVEQHGWRSQMLTRFIREEEGATAIEYGLIASLIAVAIVTVLLTLGPKLREVFQTVEDSLRTS
jgi:pilus assembly protein Flp/PilA